MNVNENFSRGDKETNKMAEQEVRQKSRFRVRLENYLDEYSHPRNDPPLLFLFPPFSLKSDGVETGQLMI